jgi:UDP-glucose 4-epimerase
MKVFVTGVAGFLGSHVAEHYAAQGAQVSGIDSLLSGDEMNVPAGIAFRKVDCRQPDRYADLVDSSDIVYHCAAAAYEGLSVFSPQVVYENTLMSTVATLVAAANGRVGRFVFCSSMARYGHQKAPFHEEMPPSPVDPYGCAKVAAEEAVRTLCGIHGMEWSIVVPHNIYGPRQRFTDPFRNVVSIMINRILQGKRPVVYGDGSQRRTFSYIDDVLGPLAAIGESPRAVGEVINVGPDWDGITVLDLAQRLLRLLNSDLQPIFYPARPQEVRIAECSAGKARRLLGYEPLWDLDEGLKAIVEWIRAYGPLPFDYHLPLEIASDATPVTWTEHLI